MVLEQVRWADRGAIMDSLMRASTSVGQVSRTYIALPKATASIVDARLFQERGIGLITYDQRNVEEALPARFFEINAATFCRTGDSTHTGHFEKELHEIRAEFNSLQRIVQDLKEELACSRKIHAPQVPELPSTLGSTLSGVQDTNDLPSFFAGNPWMEVLSKRGREEPRRAG